MMIPVSADGLLLTRERAKRSCGFTIAICSGIFARVSADRSCELILGLFGNPRQHEFCDGAGGRCGYTRAVSGDVLMW